VYIVLVTVDTALILDTVVTPLCFLTRVPPSSRVTRSLRVHFVFELIRFKLLTRFDFQYRINTISTPLLKPIGVR
jgi:hypothetical protein